MSLIDQVYIICEKYKNEGWGNLLLEVSKLNISQKNSINLGVELARDLTENSGIDRKIDGFQDFNLKGKKGIEPGKPSQSLLYHAFASPGVTADTLTAYPTIAELNIIENYIFAVAKRTLSTIEALASGRPVGVCVFSYDYRTGWSSVLGKSAQLCFSRSGVARVGNAPYAYMPKCRGFVPWKEDDADNVMRVIPARYGAFLSILAKGDDDKLGEFGPMEKNFLHDHPDVTYMPQDETEEEVPNDNDLDFWVPVHKIFSGEECLTDFVGGSALQVSLESFHINQKLSRIQTTLQSRSYPADPMWSPIPLDTKKEPFTIVSNLADFTTTDAEIGQNVILPKDQPIVEQAQIDLGTGNQDLTFSVKPVENAESGYGLLFSSFNIEPNANGGHQAPEYLNVRQRVAPSPANLNTVQTEPIVETIEDGNYTSKVYLDYSADGWIKATVPQLNNKIAIENFVSAYSIISPPRFIPYVNQREIIVWTEERMRNYRNWPRMWSVIPWALSEDRIAPNIKLLNSGFKSNDLTATAIVSMPEDNDLDRAVIKNFNVKRMDFLTDAGAGTYAPGWDTSYDTDAKGDAFLSAYGLGSPFPEDAMICSALGSFWPTAAPDTTRLYSPYGDSRYRTVAPLTDKEIGLDGGVSWDGTPPPTVQTKPDGTKVVIYRDINYNDYVQNFLAGNVTIKLLERINLSEYQNRVISIYHAYVALLKKDRKYQQTIQIDALRNTTELWTEYASRWLTLSFAQVDSVPQEALQEAGVNPSVLTDPIYKIIMFQSGCEKEQTPAFNQVEVEITKETTLYAYPGGIILNGSVTKNKWIQGDLSA